MTAQPTVRPSASYLLRVLPRVERRRTVVYELQDLASGQRRCFRSLAALRRFLADVAVPADAETLL